MNSPGSAMTNHRKLIDVAASLDRNCHSFTKEKGILKIDQSVKCRDIGFVWELHAPTHWLLLLQSLKRPSGTWNEKASYLSYHPDLVLYRDLADNGRWFDV